MGVITIITTMIMFTQIINKTYIKYVYPVSFKQISMAQQIFNDIINEITPVDSLEQMNQLSSNNSQGTQ